LTLAEGTKLSVVTVLVLASARPVVAESSTRAAGKTMVDLILVILIDSFSLQKFCCYEGTMTWRSEPNNDPSVPKVPELRMARASLLQPPGSSPERREPQESRQWFTKKEETSNFESKLIGDPVGIFGGN
jgi:hypothetical protein